MKTRFKTLTLIAMVLLVVLSMSIACFADGETVQEPTQAEINNSVSISINTIWVLIAAFLVFFMQAGFAMVETGLTRAKNASNIIMKNLMDFAIGSIAFYIIGFGIMFGKDAGGIFGTTLFFAKGSFDHLGLGVPPEAFILFQTVFAATAATIVSGAMAERTKFAAYVVYSAVISLVIYPVVGHWIWNSEGWLFKMGFIDFAGSTVVHSVGGWAALVGAALIGPRVGKYTKKKPNAIPGHSITLAALGVFILWFGWFGFNPGSTLSGMNMDIGRIAMTTNLAAAAGACVVMIISWIRYGKPDVSMTLNGALAGLVAITAGCAAVSMDSAIIIGAIAGVVVLFGVEFIEKVLRIDDPVGAVAVHGLCGVTGTILVGVFATDGGLINGGGFKLLATQAIGVLAVGAWVLATTYVLFSIIKATIGLRVSKEEEIGGLDISEHGTEAYADFQGRSAEVL